MSATQPPDPWQANSPTLEHEVYEPDPDDDDTGPLQVSTPSPDDGDPPDRHRLLARKLPATVPRLARGDDTWPNSFDTPLVVSPRSVRRDRKPSTTLTTRTGPASRSPDADAANPVARGRLLSLLPPRYPPKLANRPHCRETHWQSSVAKRTPTRAARCRRRTRWCATKPRWVGLSS